MLLNIRDKAQGTIAKVIVFLIAITFALWGVDSIVGGMQGEPEVAEVNGESITEAKFARSLEQKRRQIINQMGEQFDPSLIDESLLRRSVLEELIQEQVLFNAAEDKGLVVSNAVIDQYIRSLPVFQQDGKFSQEAYASTLRSAGMLPMDFRQAITRELMLQQDREAARQTAFVTPKELDQLIRLDRQSRDFSYLVIPADQYKADIAVSNEEVQEYYQSNVEQFRLPERVVVEYLELDKAALSQDIEVSEEDLKTRYEQEMQRAEQQEERNASHILIEFSEEVNEQQALEKIQDIERQLKEGASFEELAKEYSQDPGSASAGGDLGYVTPGVFVPEFDEALFAMNVGNVSEPVKTGFGYHLIKLNDVRKREAPSFEEMRDQLTDMVRQEKAEQLYIEKAEKLADISFSAADLEEPAEAVGLKIQQSSAFSQEGGTGIFTNPRVVRAAFELEEGGHNSELIEVGKDRSIVLRVKDKLEPQVQPLDVVQPRIRESLLAQKSMQRAKELGEQLIAELQAGANLDEVSQKAQGSWVHKEKVQRGQSDVEPAIVRQAFSMPRPAAEVAEARSIQGGEVNGNQFAVVVLHKVEDGSVESYSDTERKTILDIITQSVGGREYSLKTELLQDKAEIKRT